MSTDWHVYCIDCEDTYGFDAAHYGKRLMVLLCKHAKTIAALAPLLAEGGKNNIWLTMCLGHIDAAWFEKHGTHRLAPISEYGDILGTLDVQPEIT